MSSQVMGMIGAARKRLAARPPGETPRTEAIEAGGTLFIIAPKRDGPPLAVKRIAGPSLPLAFAVGPEDVMLRGTPLDGDVRFTARLKRDGTTGPAVPGDLEGATKTPVRVGRSAVATVMRSWGTLRGGEESHARAQ